MVLVVAAIAGAEIGEVRHEFDGLDPFEPSLSRARSLAWPPRRVAEDADRRPVHLIGEDGRLASHVVDFMDVVITANFGTVRE
jgi:hypothetical protein